MTHDEFWRIIEAATRCDPYAVAEWDQRLMEALTQLPASEIIEWNHIFDRLAKTAFNTHLWAAAYEINGGASDGGFYYFRCWLIAMGRNIYGAAVADPDTLADVVKLSWDREGIDAEAEIYAVAHMAWMQVTGSPDTAPYPARNESTELVGEDWDFEDSERMKQLLPRLTSLCATRYD